MRSRTGGNFIMRVTNLKVYDFYESIVAAGYAMRTDEMSPEQIRKEVDVLRQYIDFYGAETMVRFAKMSKESKASFTEQKQLVCKHLSRAINLGNSKVGSGHGNYLNGIRVSFDLTLTNKAWVEWERYHFQDIVSSQSTMHRITKFDLKSQFNKYVWDDTIEKLQKKCDEYNALEDKGTTEAKELYLEILYNVPSGIELTARVTTDYSQLKTMYYQRKDHRLPEWREFCEYIEEKLPLFKTLCLGK